MFNRTDVVYSYDGTFDGLLCCVFESFLRRERPQSIVSADSPQLSLLPVKTIETDASKAARVAAALPKRMGQEAADQVHLCYLTCLEDRELVSLDFIHQGFAYGPDVLNRLTDDTVHTMRRAVGRLTGESHLLKGFIRFSDYDGMLVAVIHPKNLVLPLLREHFCDRFCNERFVIYDENHGMGLVYRPYESQIVPIDDLVLRQPDEEELRYQQLWRQYYDAIAIKARANPKCRMSHMPKRYWDYMTEFGSTAVQSRIRSDMNAIDSASAGPGRIRPTAANNANDCGI